MLLVAIVLFPFCTGANAEDVNADDKPRAAIDFGKRPKVNLIVVPPPCVIERHATCEVNCSRQSNACLAANQALCGLTTESSPRICKLLASACVTEHQYCVAAQCARIHFEVC